MKQLVFRIAALAAIAVIGLSLAAPHLAAAEDGPVDTGDAVAAPPVRVPCDVEALIAPQFPGFTIDKCPKTFESPAKKADGKTRDDALDQYTVRAHAANGTKLEILIEKSGKVVHTTKLLPHADRLESQGPGMALLFWAFAAAAVGGALFVVTRRNLIAAVMGMVGSFLGIAAIYMMLYAHFLAVVQMLVYAGAIMVLFVFVIMILNRPEDEPIAPTGRTGQALGILAIVYLVGRLAFILIKVKAPAAAMLAPVVTQDGHDWGSVKAVGTDLFNGGLFPFEAISILLLVAVVGAIAIARPLVEKDEKDNKDAHTDLGGHA